MSKQNDLRKASSPSATMKDLKKVYDKAWLEEEIARYGLEYFNLLQEVATKSPFSYEEVAQKLPLVDPDWIHKSADELALKLTQHFYR